MKTPKLADDFDRCPDGNTNADPVGPCEFIAQAREQFRYLVDDYAFVAGVEKYDPNNFGNALVEFESDTVGVRVILDRGQVLVDVKPHSESWANSFGLPTILEYLVLDVNESSYVFPHSGDHCERISWQLARTARVFREFCGPVLTGEFSDWDAMDKWRRKRAEDGYRRITGKAPITIESEDLHERLQRELNRRARGTKE